MEKEQNSCYTYFTAVGDFDPEELTRALGLTPFSAWKVGDKRRDGSLFDFARWSFGRCEEYDVITDVQIMKTIAPLIPKTDILNELRERLGLEYYIEIVPSLYAESLLPALAPSLEVIDFCHKTRTELDIDLYLYNSTESD